jgi:hypothetical protein
MDDTSEFRRRLRERLEKTDKGQRTHRQDMEDAKIEQEKTMAETKAIAAELRDRVASPQVKLCAEALAGELGVQEAPQFAASESETGALFVRSSLLTAKNRLEVQVSLEPRADAVAVAVTGYQYKSRRPNPRTRSPVCPIEEVFPVESIDEKDVRKWLDDALIECAEHLLGAGK